MTIAFAPAIVFVMVGIKPDRAHIPHLWLMPAYALHHFNKHLAIFYGLLIIQGSNIVFDRAVALRRIIVCHFTASIIFYMALTRISLVIPLAMINVMQGT